MRSVRNCKYCTSLLHTDQNQIIALVLCVRLPLIPFAPHARPHGHSAKRHTRSTARAKLGTRKQRTMKFAKCAGEEKLYPTKLAPWNARVVSGDAPMTLAIWAPTRTQASGIQNIRCIIAIINRVMLACKYIDQKIRATNYKMQYFIKIRIKYKYCIE